MPGALAPQSSARRCAEPYRKSRRHREVRRGQARVRGTSAATSGVSSFADKTTKHRGNTRRVQGHRPSQLSHPAALGRPHLAVVAFANGGAERPDAHSRNRTCDLRFRKPSLYPTELCERGRVCTADPNPDASRRHDRPTAATTDKAALSCARSRPLPLTCVRKRAACETCSFSRVCFAGRSSSRSSSRFSRAVTLDRPRRDLQMQTTLHRSQPTSRRVECSKIPPSRPRPKLRTLRLRRRCNAASCSAVSPWSVRLSGPPLATRTQSHGLIFLPKCDARSRRSPCPFFCRWTTHGRRRSA